MANLQETPTMVAKATKTLTAMVSLTAIANGAKSAKKVKVTKKKAGTAKEDFVPQSYFTSNFRVKSVIDTKHERLNGRDSFAANLFGDAKEIADAYTAIKAGNEVTAYMYSDANGDVLLRLRPTKLTKREIASMLTDDVAHLDNVSNNARKFVNLVDDSELDDEA